MQNFQGFLYWTGLGLVRRCWIWVEVLQIMQGLVSEAKGL